MGFYHKLCICFRIIFFSVFHQQISRLRFIKLQTISLFKLLCWSYFSSATQLSLSFIYFLHCLIPWHHTVKHSYKYGFKNVSFYRNSWLPDFAIFVLLTQLDGILPTTVLQENRSSSQNNLHSIKKYCNSAFSC